MEETQSCQVIRPFSFLIWQKRKIIMEPYLKIIIN